MSMIILKEANRSNEVINLPIVKLSQNEKDLLTTICSKHNTLTKIANGDKETAENIRYLGILTKDYQLTDRGLAHALFDCKISILELIKTYGEVGIERQEIEKFRRVFKTDQEIAAVYQAMFHQYIKFDMWAPDQTLIGPQTQEHINIITNEVCLDLLDSDSIDLDTIKTWLGLPQDVRDKEQMKQNCLVIREQYVKAMKGNLNKQSSNLYVRSAEFGKNGYVRSPEIEKV